MKATVFLAEGFEEVEALTPVDLLRRCGAQVTTVGVGRKTVCSSHGIAVVADETLGEHDYAGDDMIVLPGGMPGSRNLYASPEVCDAVLEAVRTDRYVAAICAAPSVVFGGLGILNGKKATCYPGMEDGMTGAQPVNAPYVVDGKIITGRGAGAAMDFALALCEVLFGHEKAASMAKSVCYDHF